MLCFLLLDLDGNLEVGFKIKCSRVIAIKELNYT